MEIKTLASKIYVDFNEEELNNVEQLIKDFDAELDILNSINTEDVVPMDLVFELNENSLRMDDQGPLLSVEEVLANAVEADDNMVKIVKVVG